MAMLSQSEWNALHETATRLEIIDPQWLYDLIDFESGWNPKAANPRSSAKGLIQFLDSTARGLGYNDSQDLVNRHPGRISQLLGPVTDYLRPYTPFNTEQSLYMAVFYPAARNWPTDTTFASRMSKSAYRQFREGNPGINTVGDYMAYLKKKPIARMITSNLSVSLVVVLAGVAALSLFLARRR